MNITFGIYLGLLSLFFSGLRLLGDGKQSFTRRREFGRFYGRRLWQKGKTRVLRFQDTGLFSLCSEIGKRMRSERMEREIYQGISYLRNMIAIEKGRRMSANWILEELADLGGEMQKLYVQLLQHLRVNDKKEALACFTKGVITPLGEDYGRLLVQWEDLNPDNLIETLQNYQKIIREVRKTNQKKRDELISDLVYLPVVVNIMLILVNFIYVAYFIDQRKLLLLFLQ